MREQLELIVEFAGRLRETGVCGQVSVGDCSFHLLPPDPQLSEPDPEEAARRMARQLVPNPLDDPATYGRADGTVPGYTFDDDTDE